MLDIIFSKNYNYFRTRYKKKLVPSWYHAEHLDKRDIILYPIYKEIKDVKSIKVNIPKKKYGKSKNIPLSLPLDSELLRLFGYFISEGNIQDKPCRTYIAFTLNIKEKYIIKDIKKISKRLFGLDVTVRETPERKTAVVYLFKNTYILTFQNRYHFEQILYR